MGDIHLEYGVTFKEYTSSTSMMREARVSWINDLFNHALFDVASLDRRYALKFYLWGTCSISKEEKRDDRFHTFCKYFIN